MVTFNVIGHRGYLGRAVEKRWRELGAFPVPLEAADYVINCVRPDNLALSRSLVGRRVIFPSTDAIHEPTDYARMKDLLEGLASVTIRAGIVDIRHDYPVAYTNWLCNPITPLEWAELAWDVRDLPGTYCAGRETVSRWEVAATVASLWGRPMPEAQLAERPLSRVVYDLDRAWPRLAPALRAFKDWAQ